MHQEDKSFKQKFLDSFSVFLSKYWKIIAALPLIIIILIAAATIYNVRKTDIIEKSTALVEIIQNDFFEIASEGNSENLEEKLFSLIPELDGIIDKYSSFYAGQRALFIKGQIFMEIKDYSSAADIFNDFSRKYSDNYMAPIAINNSAICYEETGEIRTAIEKYKLIIDNYSDIYPFIPDVYFAIGRIFEDISEFESASEKYAVMINKYPDSDWTNLARNRIIYLKASGKI